MTDLVLIGGGRMGEALLAGLLADDSTTTEAITVVEPSPERAAALRERFPGVTVGDEPVAADGAILATKPDVVPDAAAALERAGGSPRVLSIAAGVRLATIEAVLDPACAVIRAMPNTPALLGAGMTAIAPGRACNDDDLAWAESLLAGVGDVVRVAESKLDAVTGLSGSGPAYVFLVAEALADAGVRAGLDRATAERLTHQTLLGAARLLVETGDGASALRAAVTSPAGTTAEGLAALERAGVRAAFIDAVEAATKRSRALGAT